MLLLKLALLPLADLLIVLAAAVVAAVVTAVLLRTTCFVFHILLSRWWANEPLHGQRLQVTIMLLFAAVVITTSMITNFVPVSTSISAHR